MLLARFSHLHFCQSLHTLQRGLSATADLLVTNSNHIRVSPGGQMLLNTLRPTLYMQLCFSMSDSLRALAQTF